ncbi:MAG: hypothetical protein GY716_25590 [bacterium]|nr:hypothetical protein [bacterium]
MRLRTIHGCIVLLACGLAAAPAPAGAPTEIHYQGHIAQTSGQPFADGNYLLELRIFDAATGGSLQWGPEVHDPVPVFDGRFAVVLGAADSLSGVFGEESRYLSISVGPSGGSVGAELVPRQQMVSVPYSMSSQNTDKLVGAVRTDNDPDGTGRLLGDGVNGNRNFELTSDPSDHWHGALTLHDAGGTKRVRLASVPNDNSGLLELTGPNGSPNVIVGSDPSNHDYGRIQLLNESFGERAAMGVDSAGVGYIRLRHTSNNPIVTVDRHDNNNDMGRLRVLRATGEVKGEMRAESDNNSGRIILNGENNSQNLYMGNSGNDNSGQVAVKDSSGQTKAWITIDKLGMGNFHADSKNFVVDHPDRPGHRIIYVSVEGPEAAMFWRGRVRLEQGRATLTLPEHFAALALPGSLTVRLTPHSYESKGVAVGGIEGERIKLGELHGGRGSYEVSYEVLATRRRHAGHEPVMSEEAYRDHYGLQEDEP